MLQVWVGKHPIRHYDWDVDWLHLNQWDVLEARGYSRTNMQKYPKEDITVVNVYGKKFYFDVKLFAKWYPNRKKQNINEVPLDTIEHNKDVIMEFKTKHPKAIEGRTFVMAETGKHYGGSFVYEIIFKDTWKRIFWLPKNNWWEMSFTIVNTTDEWTMYLDWRVDSNGDTI